MQPLKIKLVDDGHLFIQWDDKTDSILSLQKMRAFCPCAICISSRLAQSKNYIPILLSSQLEVSGIEMVGNYAVKIEWKDGHDTGIYEYSSLQKYIVDSFRTNM